MSGVVNRFRERAVPYRALMPQNVNNSQINGDTISSPWRIGRTIAFLIAAGAMATNDSLTFGIERRRAGTSTWDKVYEPNGSTNLIFTVNAANSTTGTKAGRLRDGLVMFGELDLTRLKTDKTLGQPDLISGVAYDYDAIRLYAVNAAAQNVLCAATAILTDLYDEVGDGDAVEDLLAKQRYTAGTPTF